MKKEDDKNELYISCHSRTTTYGTKKSHVITFTSRITKTIYNYRQYILQTLLHNHVPDTFNAIGTVELSTMENQKIISESTCKKIILKNV